VRYIVVFLTRYYDWIDPHPLFSYVNTEQKSYAAFMPKVLSLVLNFQRKKTARIRIV
jgi:hypothetical protein